MDNQKLTHTEEQCGREKTHAMIERAAKAHHEKGVQLTKVADYLKNNWMPPEVEEGIYQLLARGTVLGQL